MKQIKSVWDAPGFSIPLLTGWCIALVFAYEVPYGYEILHLNSWRHEPFNSFFRFMTHWGEVYAFVVAGLALLFVRYRYTLIVALAGLLNIPLSYVAKDVFASLRPLTWLEQGKLIDQLVRVPEVELASGFTSFPSGHTTAAFTLFGLLALMNWGNSTYRGLFCALAAMLTGFSRIFLAQHFLADVLGGSVFGLLIGQAAWTAGFSRFFNRIPWIDRRLNLS